MAVDPPRGWEFEGVSDGGGSARIVYTLTPLSTGTHFERELVYHGPNLLFAIVNAWRVRGVMEADSAEALQRLKRAIEARLLHPDATTRRTSRRSSDDESPNFGGRMLSNF